MLQNLDREEGRFAFAWHQNVFISAFSRPKPQANDSTDVAHCVEWAIRATSQSFQQRANLVTHLGVTPLVNVDESRLGQVLINLLVNAAQSIPTGQATQGEVSISTHTNPSGRVVIEVRDTGEGIPKEVLARIFEPFFTTKPIGVGTGLGLSICHGIISSMGGEIKVESKVGQGTSIQVLLPAPPGQVATPTLLAEFAGPLPCRILIVDDDDMVLRVLKRILKGYEVHCVNNAPEALEMIEQGQNFDLILCDLLMPAMTGIEFYESLLGSKPELARRIIFLSGGATTARAHDFLHSVSNLQIEKPFDVEILKETIHRLLSETSQPKLSARQAPIH